MGSGITVANMTDTTTLNPALPTRKVVIGNETIVVSEVEIDIPDVDAILDEYTNHIAGALGAMAGEARQSFRLFKGHPRIRNRIQGYNHALEDVEDVLGKIREQY